MTRPTPDSPPPMVLSAENREFIKNLVDEIWSHGLLSIGTAEGLIESLREKIAQAISAAAARRTGFCPAPRQGPR